MKIWMAAKSSFAFRNNGEKGYNSGFYEAIGKKTRIESNIYGEERNEKKRRTKRLKQSTFAYFWCWIDAIFINPSSFQIPLREWWVLTIGTLFFASPYIAFHMPLTHSLCFFSSLSRQPFSNLFLFTFIFFYGGKKNTPLAGSYVCWYSTKQTKKKQQHFLMR